MDLERIAKDVADGRLVEVTFLSDRGRETGSTGDHPCADARVRGDRFAYFPAFGSCAHAVDVGRVEEEGDETLLHGSTGEMKVRLRVSPVWTDMQREIVRCWAADKDAALVGRELGRALE